MDDIQTISATPRFKGEILRQIYRVWLFRKLLPVLILEIVLFAAVLYFLGRAVFIQRVFENALNVLFSDPPQIFSFVVKAFVNAKFATQVFTLVAAVFLALVLRSVTQGILRLILVRENYFSRVGK